MEKNKKRMQELYHDIEMGIKNKISESDFYEYNKYLEKECEYNIRFILEKYYNGVELTSEDKESIGKYMFFSGPFYAGKEAGPDLYDLRLKSSFGSGNFDSEELELIQKINNERKLNNKER